MLKTACRANLEFPPSSPFGAFSSSSTLAPSSAAYILAVAPADPYPTTITSYSPCQSTVLRKSLFCFVTVSWVCSTNVSYENPVMVCIKMKQTNNN
ncbi:MAG: hypothetical protein GX818_09840, partial [Tissierellia bacterium]|nr:hypothetical protein [Tissierellia bacterium]